MYEDLARTVLVEDNPAIVRSVERLRERYPRASSSELARRLEQQTAWRCAAVGASASAAMAWIDRFVAVADLPYQSLALSRLAASIARAHRRETTFVERGLVAAGGLLVAGGSDLLRRGSWRIARRALASRAPRLVPLISALAGGAISYAAAKAFAAASEELLPDLHRRIGRNR